jgi:thymidylate synthase
MKSIHIVERTLPLAWEKAVLACWNEGESFATEYDKPGDPPSRDVVATVHVKEPFAEPRIHRAFPAGLDDLEKYRAEVLYGVHDHWIDPAAGKWEYTYHQRLFAYEAPGAGVHDQIAAVIARLRSAPHTRRAQAVTWQVWNDSHIADPACLQRLWFRVSDGRLHLVAHMRSNDAFKAAFMNMYAFTELQAMVARSVGVEAGEYIHVADSFHIYGSYFAEFEGFMAMAKSRPVQERLLSATGTLPGAGERVADLFVEGLDKLLAEPDMPEEKKTLLRQRKAELAKSA